MFFRTGCSFLPSRNPVALALKSEESKLSSWQGLVGWLWAALQSQQWDLLENHSQVILGLSCSLLSPLQLWHLGPCQRYWCRDWGSPNSWEAVEGESGSVPPRIPVLGQLGLALLWFFLHSLCSPGNALCMLLACRVTAAQAGRTLVSLQTPGTPWKTGFWSINLTRNSKRELYEALINQ